MIGLLRRNRAGVFLILLLVIGAVLGTIADERNSSGPAQPPLSSTDAGPGGALALALWLERLGYGVERIQGEQSVPDASIDLAFVLDPSDPFSRQDAQAMLNWVRRGGTLVYVLPPFPIQFTDGASTAGTSLADQLRIGVRYGAGLPPAGCRDATPCGSPDSVTPTFPFFRSPAARSFWVDDAWALDLSDDSWIPLILRTSGGKSAPVVATRAFGSGRVYAFASGAFFSNRGIDQRDNAAFLLNLLARTRVTTVAFDEYHHGITAAPDLLSTARRSPWGWAIAYAAIVGFFFAAWGGRRFGPAIVPERPVGRSGGEYVSAFAGLLQRQRGAATWAQEQLARLIRRRLAREHAVPADLPASELARVVAERQPIDAVALANALGALDGPSLGEPALLTCLRDLEHTLGRET
ncbi:MAG TPA: DUF4350 domain-containing protein [Chloroflexota bacterium]|nr:DUF4350 domain-containing protein [Chloroflexota bacterium]